MPFLSAKRSRHLTFVNHQKRTIPRVKCQGTLGTILVSFGLHLCDFGNHLADFGPHLDDFGVHISRTAHGTEYGI